MCPNESNALYFWSRSQTPLAFSAKGEVYCLQSGAANIAHCEANNLNQISCIVHILGTFRTSTQELGLQTDQQIQHMSFWSDSQQD